MSGRSFDVLVVGAGIAGVSVGAALASRGRIVDVVEAEDAPARHTTGRSAAVFTENYGNAIVRALTIASRDFLERPPDGFSDNRLLSERGALWIGRHDQVDRLDALAAAGRALVPSVERLSEEDAIARCPALDGHAVAGAVWEPDARDIDVDALLQGYLRVLRTKGGSVHTSDRLVSATWAADHWDVRTSTGDATATWIVNAAGAWADEVAESCGLAPVGLQPLRRTAFLFDPPPGVEVRGWPLVIDVDERFYFKPDSGLLLGSLADETPSAPCDAKPEEADIALALDRIGDVLPTVTRRVRRAWAGLRTFAPDRTPVIGVEPGCAFCWVAGQGGYGIQTAPAIAAAAASLVVDGVLPAEIAAVGLTPADLGPHRRRSVSALRSAPVHPRDGGRR